LAVKERYSTLKKLNEKFNKRSVELILANTSIEDLIVAKLELSSRKLNGKLAGFPIAHNISQLIKESLVKFALNSNNSKRKAAAALGLSVTELYRFQKKHNLLQEE